MLKKLLSASAIAIALITSVGAAELFPQVTLTLGRLDVTAYGVAQYATIHNNTSRAIDMATVECGFFSNGALTGVDKASVFHVVPGGDAFATVGTLVHMPPIPDRVQCRISDVEPR